MISKKYLQPKNLEELTYALGQMTDNSKILCGGTDLMIVFREKGMDLDVLLSITNVPEIKGITEEMCGDSRYLRIGAATTYAELATSLLIQKECAAMAMAADHVGSQQIRNRGSIGGNLVNASVGGDMIPLMYLFHGELEIMNHHGERRWVKMEDFHLGVGRTILSSQEILLAIRLPLKGKESVFHKLGAREEVTIADISLCLSWNLEDNVVKDTEMILGAVDVKPISIVEVGEYLDGKAVGNADTKGLAEVLRRKIHEVAVRRSRPSKLRIHSWEQNYKELAVRGVVEDTLQMMIVKGGLRK